MTDERSCFAVVVGNDIVTPDRTGPELGALDFHPLHGRVVRIGDRLGSRLRIYYGADEHLADPASLRAVHDISFEAGDLVLYKGEPASVRDVIWHFKDDRANYYVTQEGRRVSKRLFNQDLQPLPRRD